MTKKLDFKDFETSSAKAWKQKIQFDLKGEDYNETLLTKTDEGITIKPFYTKEDRKPIAVKTQKKRLISVNLFLLMMKKLPIN